MREQSKNIVLIVLGVVLLGMTIAYAALQTNLSIGGTASTPALDWNVNIANWAESTKSTGVTYTGPTITSTSISNLAITLPKPGDTITFTFKIVNDGTINAKLSNYSGGFTCDQTGTGACGNLTYSLSCNNNATTVDSLLLASNSGSTDEATCTLIVTNKAATVATGQTTYHQNAASGSFNAQWTYSQE